MVESARPSLKILQYRDVLSIVLAGGMGERLYPLTRDRAKPSVPFGGRYRIVDFVLNNLVNSGLMKIKVLTQFKSNSLIEHLVRAWRLNPEIGQFVDPAVGHQPPLQNDTDSVADHFDVVQNVCTEKDGLPAIAQVQDQIADLLASDRVQASHRLVEDDQFRVVNPRLR